jgi:C-terminal processing protease CtpA/Prc
MLTITSCFEDLDDNTIAVTDINDFVWKGMNSFYVYKDSITDLSNTRFSTNESYTNYLNDYNSPEDLFESLLFRPNDVDEFSQITDNYFNLQQLLNGTTESNGMAFGLVQFVQGGSLFGYIRYIMPNTDAEEKGLTRGQVFNTIDGITITLDNYRNLLSSTTYTLGFADYNDNGTAEITSDDTVTSNGSSVTLTKSSYTENPILSHSIINENGSNIGYLMYNNFRIADTNLNELNSIFAEFQASGISDLVLDLRYNGGGSVSTAIWLASMITGQHTGEVFFKEQWNTEIQASLEQSNPDAVINPFVNEMIKRNSDNDIIYQQTINSLNLNKVYILTSVSSASASELVINCLAPYMEVVQIGTTTRGKPQASITIYDSPDFTRSNVNPNHNYALQPLIYESANANGVSQYYDGIDPTDGYEISENYGNLGQLGNAEERLLAEAIADITGLGRAVNSTEQRTKQIGDQNFKNPYAFDMVDDRPLKINVVNQ